MPDFPSTIWQDLERARSGEASGWSAVVARYRPAVVAFLRRRGQSEADAEDLAQEVFLQFVRGHVLAGAGPARGRFRSLILAVACNILRHRVRDDRAEKRGGGRRPLSLEDLDVAAPEDRDLFDREWVARLVASALEELSRSRPAYHDALRMVLEEHPQAEIARTLGRSVAQVNNQVHRARMWIRRRIRALVRESCADPETCGAELAHLSRYVDLSGT
ncbi:MAG: sigma-70 family RNA polymerase sigma factor [Candidatus Brocadiae bacterium]|nr:sigma-70 family RNA polymerase sigma factor [Candidatus Brocadiia bacterium]